MEKSVSAQSNSVNTIEASIVVRKKRRPKKRCKKEAAKPISSPKSGQISLPNVRSVSSLKSMVSNSSYSGVKVLSAPELIQRSQKTLMASPMGKKVPELYSSLLFSADSSMSKPETQIFNQTHDFNFFASEANLNDSFMSEYEERLNNSQMHLQSEAEQDWEHLSQQISPRDSGENSKQHNNLAMEHHSRSEVTFDQVFQCAVNESTFELSPSHYHCSDTDKHCLLNDVKDDLNERPLTQNVSLSSVTKQNQRISEKLDDLECYVKEKVEAVEDYVKRKLTQIEEANWAIVKALNDMKRVEPIRSQRVIEPTRIQRNNEATRTQRDKEITRTERDTERVRSQQVKQLKSTKELIMPKIPISRYFSLVILNSALKKADYMEQFVSEASRLVTSTVYNCRKLVRSIMTELFTIDLLVKYRWSARTISSRNKPTFSSFTNVLSAVVRLLTNYMSAHNVRREIKDFLKEMQ